MSLNPITIIIDAIDSFQKRYRFTAFIYGVIKKYGEDQAGYQAALLTYYAFLSLFPLLLVLTTVTGLLASSHPALQQSILKGITDYIPSLGSQLSTHVNGMHKTGPALFIGLLFAFYGARGVADAFRNGVNHLWQIPVAKRDGFPKNVGKSLLIIIGGGTGLIIASICSGLAAGAGHGVVFRLLSLLINIVILFGLFAWLLNLSLPRHVSLRDIRSGALTAAIGLVLLQAVGAALLRHQLKNLDAVNSYFATALGLLFWLYLQAQVLYYSVEVSVVQTLGLWPRSLTNNQLTAADKRALTRRVHEERAMDGERIKTDFPDNKT
jgi:inner membrane protein YhjD